MEVILREHVDNLGNRGDVVKVASGYARNYLLPRKLALAVTDANKRQIERERASAEARESEEREAAQGIANKMEAIEIVIARRVGEGDALYGSVTPRVAAAATAASTALPPLRRILMAASEASRSTVLTAPP